MGLIANLFKGPPAPQMPPPPPPPPQAPIGDPNAMAARRTAAGAEGMGAGGTIATSSQGVLTPASTTGKALTGQ